MGGDAISLPEIRYGQLQNPLYKKLILWTLNHADEVTALTQYLINNLRRTGIKRQAIKIIPFGIDTILFSFQEKPFREEIEFLHIANLHPVKDQDTLLRAFKIISDKVQARLTIIGEGISAREVKALVMELGLENKVKIFKLLSYEEVSNYYHQADILLHTSLSEGQGMVVTEAMSCGVIVCGTNVGLLHDLPNCCISVPTKDYESLAFQILQLLKNPEHASMLRQHAYKWTKEHSIWWTVDSIKKLYNR